MYDIITIGSATVDVFANTTSELVKFITPEGENDFIAYPSGSKILINDIDFLIGGGGTNTAVSFSRLGFKTGFLGKLGEDENAYKVLHLLETEHIDFLGTREGQTGYSIILDSIENDRTILTFKGGNNKLRIDEVDFSKLKTKWLYSSSMVGTSFQTLQNIIHHVHENNIKIAFNPSSYQAKQGLDALRFIVERCTVLIMNVEEAKLLLSKKEFQTKTPKELAQALAIVPGLTVVLTNGPSGAVCYHKGEYYSITPSPNLKVVETTGAGDAFASGFVSGLMYSLTIPDSLKLGMIQAENVITSIGAKNILQSKEQVFAQLEHFKGLVSLGTDNTIIHSLKDQARLTEQLVGTHIQHRVSEDLAFKFSNGNKIVSLEELVHTLIFITPDIFATHVHDGTNYFALWIQEAFGLETLANKIRACQDPYEMSKIIQEFLIKTKGE